LFPPRRSGLTDHQGLATISYSHQRETENPFVILRSGNDAVMLPGSSDWWSRAARYTPPGNREDAKCWFVVDDRELYQPGEELHFKGWIRQYEPNKSGDITRAKNLGNRVAYQVFDSQQRMIANGTTQLNVFGGFDGSLILPPTVSLGRATINFRVGSTFAEIEPTEYRHYFQIQQFRRPEYELKLTASEGPHVIGTSATATISASYFAGGPLKKADTRWKFSVMEGSYHPPNWDEFRFGKQSSSWWSPSGNNQTCTGSTDAQGHHTVQIDFDGITRPTPVVVTAEATISDVNRQQQSASTRILVHPASLVVGLKQRQGFIFPGESFTLDSIVTDLDGTPQAGKAIRLEIVRQERRFEDGTWTQIEVDPQTTTLLSAATPVIWEFSPTQSGEYQLTATVADDQNRLHQTVVSFWVAGSTQEFSSEFEEEHIKLISNRTEYAPGETAELLLQAPFFPAEGLLTIQRSGVIHRERFTLDQSARLFKLPIDESQIPNVTVQVNLVGEVFRRDETGVEVTSVPKQPAYASGTVELAVSTQSRRLTVTARPVAETVAPGSRTSIEIDVTDAAGKPVAESECALAVVDEAILALSSDHFPVDPLEAMYQKREAGTITGHSRDWFSLASLDEVLGVARQVATFSPPASGAGGGGGSLGGSDEADWLLSEAFPMDDDPLEDSRQVKTLPTGSQQNPQPPIRLRTHFSPLVAFSPSVVTNNQGRATVEIELPDNLTRYRILVFAAAGDNLFGKGDSVLTARFPLMVRPSAPRFLNLGDQCELPVVIQNQEAVPLTVEVAVRSQYLTFPEGAGRRVIVPANDRRELRIPATPIRIGPAIIDVAASTDDESDGAQAKLKIYTPATIETTAMYGEMISSAVQLPVSLPEGTLPKSGKLELTLSSTQLQSLTDSVVYLANYPFDCSEQIASRMIGLMALKDVWGQFKGISTLPRPEQFDAFFQADLNRLRSRQNADGGFSFWKKDGNSDPFLSVHVAHALIRAKHQGLISLSDSLVKNAAAYVQNIEHTFPNFYPSDAREAVRAYALYVRHFNGDASPLAARQLIQHTDLNALRLDTIGWVLPVLAASEQTQSECRRLIQHLSNRVTETNDKASFVESITDGEHLLLHSNRRTDAIVLGALLAVKPESDLIPKLVRGLLAHQTQGRWANTQENAFVLLALERYFSQHETVTPDFVARIWLGEDFAGAHTFQGRTTRPHHRSIPFDTLGTASESKPITLSKTGPGRLYYRLALEYGLDALKTRPVDAGFAISRSYHAVDDPDDVQRLGPNEWQIRAGARVQVTITMIAPSRSHHVALVDPLPAGFEILNPVFKTTGTLNWQAVQTRNSSSESDWEWFDHQNLRDNCAQVFASQVREGVYRYRYFALATTPGRFTVPPPKAEEMYSPETFG
ncbi:MAG TPA: alpha-2-macroglobulin family protein, partial [Acidobacteriota bacterium]|nr:alpha-2-macroglobulin family protein [Acidobacteriota bacterium]